jgi:hypothetical protein
LGEGRLTLVSIQQHRQPGIRALVLFLAALAACCVLFFLFLGPCATLIAHSIALPNIPLPPTCTETAQLKDNPENKWAIEYLNSQRDERGLSFQSWVECSVSGFDALADNLDHDPHWMETYVAMGYAYRRTVVVLRPPLPRYSGSRLVAVICSEPWISYLRLIRGQCDRKFLIWK